MVFGRGKPKKKPLDGQAPGEAGQIAVPNPGEYPPDGEQIGLRRNTLGSIPAQGHRAGGGTTLGPSELVALRRQLEFTAGGRAQLVQGGPVSSAEANISERTGQVQISGTEDTSQEAGNVLHPNQPTQPAPAPSSTDPADGVASNGSETGPERRRDRKGL